MKTISSSPRKCISPVHKLSTNATGLLLTVFLFLLPLFTFAGSRESDSLVLVELYNATGGDNWKNNQGWLTSPLDQWYGVTLQKETDRVRELVLIDNNLTGELPNDLVGLDSLNFLVLNNNRLHGAIPPVHTISAFSGSTYRPEMDNMAFAKNAYTYADLFADSVQWANTVKAGDYVHIQPLHVYSGAEEYVQLEPATQIRAEQGQKIELEAPFQPFGHQLYYAWWYIPPVGPGTFLGNFLEPKLTIDSFDTLAQSGTFRCEAFPPNERNYTQRQKYDVAMLQSSHNYAPSICYNGGESGDFTVTYTAGKDFYDFRLVFKDEFPGFVGNVIHLPERVQMALVEYNGIKKEDWNVTVLDTDSITVGSCYMRFRPIDVNWTGTDSMIVQLTDVEGLTSEATLYIEVEEPPVSCKPKFNPDSTYVISENGQITYHWGEQIRADSVHFQFSRNYYDDNLYGCRTRLFYDTVTLYHPADSSIFFKTETNLDFIDTVISASEGSFLIEAPLPKVDDLFYLKPSVNFTNSCGSILGWFEPVYIPEVAVSTNPIKNTELKLEHFSISLEQNKERFTLYIDEKGSCNPYYLHYWCNGIFIDSLLGYAYYESYDIPMVPGKEYQITVSSELFYTDTLELSRPGNPETFYNDTVLFDAYCQKQFSFPQLSRYPWNIKSAHIVTGSEEIAEILHDSIITISAMVGVTSTVQVVFDLYTKESDTLTFVVTGLDTPLAPEFSVSESNYSITNDWYPLDLIGKEASSPDSLQYSMFTRGNLLFKGSFPSISVRPRLGTSGIDTLFLVAVDGCGATDTALHIFTYTDVSEMSYPTPYFYPYEDWQIEATEIEDKSHEFYVYYASKPEDFPVIYLPQYTRDDRPIGEISYSVESRDEFWMSDWDTQKNDIGVNTFISGDSLYIRPVEGTVYPFETVHEMLSTGERFYLNVIAEDVDGGTDTLKLDINIAATPAKNRKGSLTFCEDTVEVDLKDYVQFQVNAMWKLTSAEVLYSSVFEKQMIAGDEPGVYYLIKKNGLKGITTDIQTIKLTIKNDFKLDYLSVKIDVTAFPSCFGNLSFSELPEQFPVSGHFADIDVSALLQSGYPVEEHFWTVKSGDQLLSDFDITTGILSVSMPVEGIVQKDTIRIVCENFYKEKAVLTVVYSPHSPIYTRINERVCDSYLFGNTLLRENGVYTDTLVSVAGGDSIVTVDLFVHPVYNDTIHRLLADGESFDFSGTTISSEGEYSKMLQTEEGCDSAVTITVKMLPSGTVHTERSVEACGSYTFDDKEYCESGIYTATYASVSGADSISLIDLTIQPSFDSVYSATGVCGRPYYFYDKALTTSGIYSEYFTTREGCDSTVRVELEVKPGQSKYHGSLDTACTFYVFHGDTLRQSGWYSKTFKSICGSDSVVGLDLKLYQQFDSLISKQLFEGETFTFRGTDYTEVGTHTYSAPGTWTCDSTWQIQIMRKAVSLVENSVAVCGSYNFRGRTLTETGIYRDSIYDNGYLAAVISLDLTIKPSYDIEIEESITYGETFAFGDSVYSESGVYRHEFLPVFACDSIVTLNLTILPEGAKITNLAESACESFVFAGKALTESGKYTDSLKSVSGVDSLVVLDLFIHKPAKTELSKTIAYGGSYVFAGQTLSETGVYTADLKTVHGCDSIVTLYLTVLPEGTKITNLAESACDSFVFAGKALTESGKYTDSLKTLSGADSLVVLDLFIYKPSKTELSETIAYGGSLVFDGQTLTEKGVYTADLKTVHGCDSTVTLNLTVSDNQLPAFDFSVTEFSIAEHSPAGTLVAQIVANDPEGAELTYSLTGGEGVFEIDPKAGTITAADSQKLDFETQSQYVLTVTVSDGTDSATAQITIRLTDIVEETAVAQVEHSLTVSPNPASCCLLVQCHGLTGVLELISGNGSVLMTLDFAHSSELDVSHLPAGQYFVRLQTGDSVLEETVIIE